MKVVELSGGVGGARMARGLDLVPDVTLTVVVNVGDDEEIHGLHVSPDIDTVMYTLAGIEGPHGWGRADDTFTVNEELGRFGVDNKFRLGDRDLALNLTRTVALASGEPLSQITERIANSLGAEAEIRPVTDQRLRTEVRIESGVWISFQEYFVHRGHRDQVRELRFTGAPSTTPAPGVIESISEADLVVIAPSNPPLSIWPILAVPGVREALHGHANVIAVSPLFGGKALKGPADDVMSSLGLSPGNAGVLEAYAGLVDTLVIDNRDSDEASSLEEVNVVVTDTLITEADQARRLALEIVSA